MKKALVDFGSGVGRPGRACTKQRDVVRYRRYGYRLSKQLGERSVRTPGGRSQVKMINGHLGGQPLRPEGLRKIWAAVRRPFSSWKRALTARTGAENVSGLMFSRQAYVGVANANYGTFTAGRQYTSYYTLLSPYSPTTWLTGAYGAHPGDIDSMDTLYRANNSLVYTSPKIYGLTVSGSYSLGGVPGSFSRRSNLERGSTVPVWSVRYRSRYPAHRQRHAGRRRMGRELHDVEQRRASRYLGVSTTASRRPPSSSALQ